MLAALRRQLAFEAQFVRKFTGLKSLQSQQGMQRFL